MLSQVQYINQINITKNWSLKKWIGMPFERHLYYVLSHHMEKYNGEVPKNMEDLISLPGVGRKSANVVMLEAFGDAQGIAVDTHCRRIANKIGLSDEKEPEKIEQDLLKIFDKEDYKDINHLLIWHGRNTCIARNPKCEECVLKEICREYAKTK